MNVCTEPGCGTLTHQRRCTAHARAYEQRRGSRQQRGYDATHDRLRARWQRRLNRERVACTSPTCLTPDIPVDPNDWQLGHDDQRQHRGPEHPLCNLSAAGRSAHGGG